MNIATFFLIKCRLSQWVSAKSTKFWWNPNPFKFVIMSSYFCTSWFNLTKSYWVQMSFLNCVQLLLYGYSLQTASNFVKSSFQGWFYSYCIYFQVHIKKIKKDLRSQIWHLIFWIGSLSTAIFGYYFLLHNAFSWFSSLIKKIQSH